MKSATRTNNRFRRGAGRADCPQPAAMHSFVGSMRCEDTPLHQPVRSTSAFTLAEVLAALLFMAIVVPVAIDGLHIAGLAGAVAERKAEAARIAQRVLTENLVTTNWSQSVQSGTTIDGQREFRWTLHTDVWTQDPNQTAMRQLSVQVEFTAQDRKYSVNMSTLVDSSQLLGGVAATQ